MSSSSSSVKHFPLERQPRMFNEILEKDDSSVTGSASSSGFESFPGRHDHHRRHHHNIRILNQNGDNTPSSHLPESLSKAAASATVSAFHAIMNTFKSIQVNVGKCNSPASLLPRCLSRKLSKNKYRTGSVLQTVPNDVETTVRVKDIVRWKSFRYLADDKIPPSSDTDQNNASFLSPGHHRHYCTTTATTTTVSTNSTPRSSSNGFSWCESNFSSEYRPSRCCNSEPDPEECFEIDEKYLPCVGSARGSTKATAESAVDAVVGPKEQELQCDKNERFCPALVVDFELEQYEHRAKLLLSPVGATSSTGSAFDGDQNAVLEHLLVDFFVDESSSTKGIDKQKKNDWEVKAMRQAEAWIKGEQNETLLIDGEACVKDMDREECWNKFEAEEEEVSLHIESSLLNLLLDELVLDLYD